MKNRILIATTIIIVLTASSVRGQNMTKETRNLKGFSEVGFGIAGDLKIKIGSEYSVVLEGNPGDLEYIVTEVSGDRLQIKQENWRVNLKEKVSVYITMPEITGLGVSGSGRAEIVDPVKNADGLDLSVSGSGRLIASSLEVDELDCAISGSGNISIGAGGSADRGEISISGSGGYSGADFEVDDLTVRVSGSGNCLCKAGDSLQAMISGSGNVTYNGDPSVDARISGSGHVRKAK